MTETKQEYRGYNLEIGDTNMLHYTIAIKGYMLGAVTVKGDRTTERQTLYELAPNTYMVYVKRERLFSDKVDQALWVEHIGLSDLLPGGRFEKLGKAAGANRIITLDEGITISRMIQEDMR